MTEKNVIEIFSPDDKAASIKEKKIMLACWFAALFVVVGVIVTLMVINNIKVNRYYDRSMRFWATAVSVVLSALFAGASLFFFSIKYRLTRKYCRLLKEIDGGLKDSCLAAFLSYDTQTVLKDGVYFYTMVVDTKPLRRGDITERHILIEHTVPPPELEEGQRIFVTTHANILTAYELRD